MPNGRRRRSGFAKKIDTVHWTYGSFSFVGQGAGTAAVQVFPAQHLPETLLRTRGEVLLSIFGAQAPNVLAGIGVGLVLVPEGLGTTVTWSPITDGDAPWLWVDYFSIGYSEAVVDVIDMPGLSSARRVIDSKAMRKIRNREIQCVVENATISGAVPVTISGQVRVLAGA